MNEGPLAPISIFTEGKEKQFFKMSLPSLISGIFTNVGQGRIFVAQA